MDSEREIIATNKSIRGILFLSFLKLGLTAFGGPAMIAYIKEMAVTRRKWLAEEAFKDGVTLCQSIPGATAMQMAAYVGLRTAGVTGALLAYSGFGFPAFMLMLLFSMLYTQSHNLSQVTSAFNGLQIIVVAIVAHATYSFGKGALKGSRDIFMAAVSAVLFGAAASPFLIIIGVSLLSIVWYGKAILTQHTAPFHHAGRKSFKEIVLSVLIPFAGLIGLFIFKRNLFNLAALMLKIDLFAFGGGFASLPLLFHEVVTVKGWVDSKTLMDGVALGQVTPGPIIITATFVGYLMYGVLGAAVATIAIFTPSFLILIITTPFFDKLKRSPAFLRATRGIHVSFIGLLLFVTFKFAFAVPWNIIRILLFLVCLGALLRKVNILYIVAAGVLLSLIMF